MYIKIIIYILFLGLVISCSKVGLTQQEIPIQEETIKLKTSLDTGIYNVIDTLPLSIIITSKLPSKGIKFLITTSWIDSSRQIINLDTLVSQTISTYKLAGHKYLGQYNLTITAISNSNSSNKTSFDVKFINDPLKRFEGYRVDETMRLKDEINYWRDCGIMWDVIVNKFNILPNGQKNSNFISQTITGDFNKDGFIDVFNPGTGAYSGVPVDYSQWLIWNTNKKIFESTSLFNNQNLKYFGGNQRRSVAKDLNKDGYTDIIIFDSGDDGLNYTGPRPLQPIRIVLSDGKGGYDLKELNDLTSKLMYNHSGDVGDLNNDGFPDLVSATGSVVYVSWGIQSYPYFSTKISYFDIFLNADNGFGENFSEGAGYDIVTLADVNKDGWLDIIGGTGEQLKIHEPALPFDMRNKVLINQGSGRFNKKGLIYLPLYSDDLNWIQKNKWTVHDYRLLDVNNDGLNDIIANGSIEYDNYNFIIYLQNPNGTFSIDKSKFIFTINNTTRRIAGRIPGFWKPWLILFDFNRDGKIDVSYLDNHDFDKELKTKSVFISSGNQFIEQDFYQYDSYIKSLR